MNLGKLYYRNLGLPFEARVSANAIKARKVHAANRGQSIALLAGIREELKGKSVKPAFAVVDAE